MKSITASFRKRRGVDEMVKLMKEEGVSGIKRKYGMMTRILTRTP